MKYVAILIKLALTKGNDVPDLKKFIIIRIILASYIVLQRSTVQNDNFQQ